MTTSVDIGTFPIQSALLAKETSHLGIEVENSSNGVTIKSVESNSPAALGGLKKGAIIVAVNQNKVQNVDEFYKQLEATEKGKPVLLLVKQGDSIRFLSLKVAGNRE